MACCTLRCGIQVSVLPRTNRASDPELGHLVTAPELQCDGAAHSFIDLLFTCAAPSHLDGLGDKPVYLSGSWDFRIRSTESIVFQLRVVAGAPKSLSIWPR